MNDDVLLVMDRIPPDALRVYLYLEHRAGLDVKVGVTQQEISRATRVSVSAIRDSLGWLSAPTYSDAGLKTQEEIAPFIAITKKGVAFEVTLLPPYSDGRGVRFTFEDTDQRRIATLEKEVRRLAAKRPQNSKLSLYIKGDRAGLLAEMERDLGRGLTTEEAFLMGGVFHHFGIERIRAVWRSKAHQMKNPVVGVYALFMSSNQGLSQSVKEPRKEVHYRSVTRDEELV